MTFFLRLLLLCAWLLAGAGAQAAITCTTLTAPAVNIGYPAAPSPAVSVQTSFTIVCDRSSTSDPTTLSYYVNADNGLHPNGVNNFAQLTSGGRNYTLSYDVWTPSCNTTQWKGNTRISGTVTWPSTTQTGPSSDTQTFWACMKSGQTAGAAGTYTDTIGLTATYNPGTGNTTLTGSVAVFIYSPAYCNISPSPTNVNLVYTAFSTLDVTGTTQFGATCTADMPYSLDVTPASGTVAGVNYNVTLSSTNATGTGAQQTHVVTVTAPSGQGGTCTGPTCSGSVTHTLTITY